MASRVLYLIDSLRMGGAERLLVSYLKHLDSTQIEPRVCALQIREGNPIGEQILQLGIPVDTLLVKNLRDITALPRLLAYMRRHKIDLVHTQLEFANTLGNTASWILGIPSIATMHTLNDPEKGSKTYRRIAIMLWILRHFCNRVVAVSEETRRHHLRVGGNKPENVITLYNGIDLTPFQQIRDEEIQAMRSQLGIPTSAQVLTTVAVLRQPKGIQYLIEALPAILQGNPEAYYLIVGDGDYRSQLEEQVRDLGVERKVIFTGYRNDIPQLLEMSDIFVLPTLTEALPTVLAEAMAASKPIIASKVGGIPEMVIEGKNGLLLSPQNAEELAAACLNLLQNPSQAQEMGKAGRKIVEERFNIPVQVKMLETLYKELLNEYKR